MNRDTNLNNPVSNTHLKSTLGTKGISTISWVNILHVGYILPTPSLLSATAAVFMDKIYATSLEENTSKTGIKRVFLHVWENTVHFADRTVDRGCYEVGY